MYCSICDSRPCYLLLTAAATVVQEQLTEDEGRNLIGAVRYAQNLERLHHCLIRHIEITNEAWQLNEHFRVSEGVLNELEKQGMDAKKLLANLRIETGDPPSLN